MTVDYLRGATLAGLLLTCGCASSSPESVARSFYAMAAHGDAIEMVARLTPAEAQWGGYVIDRQFPADRLAHFSVDSVRRASEQPLGKDTILVEVWGTGPNWEMAPREPVAPALAGVDVVTFPKQPRQLTAVEIAALPRVTSVEHLWLVRADGWRVTVQADRIGPVMALGDSVSRMCGWGDDPRPCRAAANRARALLDGLRLYNPRSVGEQFETIIRSAGVLDSLTIEDTETVAYDFSPMRSFEWVIRNASTTHVDNAKVRVFDSRGILVSDDGSTLDVKPGGRARGGTLASKAGFAPPFTYEVFAIEDY